MAVQLTFTDPHGRLHGVVSANDDDEQLFVATTELLGPVAACFVAERHSCGELSAQEVGDARTAARAFRRDGLARVAPTAAELETARNWLDVIFTVFERAAGPLRWELAFDAGGSIDDGQREYVTSARLG